MRGRKSLIAAAATGAVILAAATLGGASNAFLFGWSFTDSIWVDHGTYFRLRMKLAYKGEPQNFDIIVGCNALQINYKDGSTTSEVGLVPTVYGRRMSDGKGLVVRPPNACDGETTANRRVPPNFRPVVIVYDDAATLAFGTAYVSEDAYASPLSELSFGGATIEAATRAEFDSFRRDGPPNLVTRESYHSYQAAEVVAKMGLTKIEPAFGRVCYAYQRFRIPEAMKDKIRKYWPVDRPDYWTPPSYPLQAEAFGDFRDTPVQRDTGGAFRVPRQFYGYEYMADRGAGRSEQLVASYYPIKADIALAEWPTDRRLWPEYIRRMPEPIVATDVDVRGGKTRGFASCFDPAIFSDAELQNALIAKLAVYKADGEVIRGTRDNWGWSFAKAFAYRDEYYFTFSYIYLDSTRGDV